MPAKRATETGSMWTAVTQILNPGAEGQGLEFLVVFPGSLLLPLYYVVSPGTTVGKWAPGIVVRDQRTLGPISTGQTLGRAYITFVVWVFGFWVTGVLDGLSALRDENRRTWHDKVAGTIVVRRETHRGGGLEGSAIVSLLEGSGRRYTTAAAQPLDEWDTTVRRDANPLRHDLPTAADVRPDLVDRRQEERLPGSITQGRASASRQLGRDQRELRRDGLGYTRLGERGHPGSEFGPLRPTGWTSGPAGRVSEVVMGSLASEA